MNEDYRKAKSYQEKMGSTLHLAVEELATAIGVAAKGVDEHGRLTEEGAKNFSELLDDAGKNQIKAQQNIQKQTDKIQAETIKAFSSFAKRIPVIGKDLEKGFEKMMKNMTVRMDQLLTKTWGRLGQGMKGAMKVGAGGIVAAGALVLKQFHEIEKTSVELSKQTGLTGKNLKTLRGTMMDAQSSSYEFGISMQDSAAATAAMVKSLGNFRKVSSEMVKTATLLAKFTGVSNEEAAEFTGVMIKGFGKTAKDVMNFGNTMKDFATRSGVNSRKVMADIMQNTNLTSIYMSKGEDYLKRSAVQAAKLNMSMSETASATEQFLDIDSSAETVGKINQYMGSSLNSLELFNLAAKGDTEAVMKRLGKAFASPRGVRFMEEMPGLANKFGKEFGFNLKQMRIMAGLDKEKVKIKSAEAVEQETIAAAVKSQQTTMDQLSNKLKSVTLPLVNSIAEPIVNLISSLGPGAMKVAAGVGIVGALGALVTVLWKSTFGVQKVEIVGGAAGAAGQFMGGGPTGIKPGGGGKPGRFARAGTAMKGKFGKIATAGAGMLSAGGAASGMLATARSAANSGLSKVLGKSVGKTLLKKIPLVGAAVGAYFAFERIKKGDWLGGMMELGSGIASSFPGIGTGISVALDAGLAAKDISGLGGSSRGVQKAAKGRKFSSPTLAMVGEENRSEIVVPTERIRKGMPVNANVASELSSIGVPGFAGGDVFEKRNRVAETTNYANQQAKAQNYMGSMADPQTQRVRAVQYEQESQNRKSEMRDSMRKIENKSMEILEEEKNIAMDIGGPIIDFVGELGLWEKAKKAASKYAKKTEERFWKNLHDNNGDVMAALKDTWKQTVGDLKGLQEKLYAKIGDLTDNLKNWASGMANKGKNWLIDQAKGLGKRALDYGMDKLNINNRFNREQFSNSARQGTRALWNSNQIQDNPIFKTINVRLKGIQDAFKFGAKTQSVGLPSSYAAAQLGHSGHGIIDRTAARLGNITAGGRQSMKFKTASTVINKADTIAAGGQALMAGDYEQAAKDMAIAEAKKQVGKQITKHFGASALGSASSVGKFVPGQAYAAGAIGAMDGLAKGDVKAAGKGALEGAVGYGLGVAATAGLMMIPGMQGVAPYLGPMIGSVVAGPATKGILAGAKQQAKGLGNMWNGLKGGNFKQMGKGALQVVTAPGKMLAVAGKELGKMFGIGVWSPDEARAKSLSHMANAAKGKKPLLTSGGAFTQKKWKEGMAAAVELGENGPKQSAMDRTMADIVRVFGVTPDIAQGFIYAALGANMDGEVKQGIEMEITKGWGKMVGKAGSWQSDYDSGKLKKGWKKFRAESRMSRGGAASKAVATFQNDQNMQRARAAAAGGFTKAELDDLGINKTYAGHGSGKSESGHVYMDGVLVGVIAGSAAAGAGQDGLPTSFQMGATTRKY